MSAEASIRCKLVYVHGNGSKKIYVNFIYLFFLLCTISLLPSMYLLCIFMRLKRIIFAFLTAVEEMCIMLLMLLDEWMDIQDVKSIFAVAMYDFELFENSVLKNVYSGRIQAVQYLNIFVYILCKPIIIRNCLILNENLFFMNTRNKI